VLSPHHDLVVVFDSSSLPLLRPLPTAASQSPDAPLPFKTLPKNLLNPEAAGSHHHCLPWRAIAVMPRRRRAAGRWRARRGSGAGRRRGRRVCSPCGAPPGDRGSRLRLQGLLPQPRAPGAEAAHPAPSRSPFFFPLACREFDIVPCCVAGEDCAWGGLGRRAARHRRAPCRRRAHLRHCQGMRVSDSASTLLLLLSRRGLIFEAIGDEL
jgi:hypothetical protein